MGLSGQRLAALSPGKTLYRLYRRLGGPLVGFGRVWEISSPPEFDPRTVQPAASRYTIPIHTHTHTHTQFTLNVDLRKAYKSSWHPADFSTFLCIHTYGSNRIFHCLMMVLRPKHVTFTDEFGNSLLCLTAVHLPALLYGIRYHT